MLPEVMSLKRSSCSMDLSAFGFCFSEAFLA